MQQLSFQGRGPSTGGAFGMIDPMQATQQSMAAGAQQTAAMNQNAVQQANASVGQILQGVLQKAQSAQGQGNAPGQLGMDLSNPSGFQAPQTQPQVPSQPQGVPSAPTGAFAQKAAAPTQPMAGNVSTGPMSATGELSKRFGAFNDTPQSVPPVQNNSVVPQQGAFGQAASEANGQSGQTINANGVTSGGTSTAPGIPSRPQGAFGGSDMELGQQGGELLQRAAQVIGDTGALPQPGGGNQGTVAMAQKILSDNGINIDLSGVADGSPEANEILSKAKELANKMHGGVAAIEAQEQADPASMAFLRNEGWGNFIDQTKRYGAF